MPVSICSVLCAIRCLRVRRVARNGRLGLLAGHAVARMDFRGKGVVWILMLLVQMVPFQLLMIPLYVQVTRAYGLGDTYLGMILPFAINTTAVFIFIQFFKSLPADIFEAARVDGAGELRILWTIAIPMVRPALATVVLVTFIGPWNEFCGVPYQKDVSMQPLAASCKLHRRSVSPSPTRMVPFCRELRHLHSCHCAVLPVPEIFCRVDIGSALKDIVMINTSFFTGVVSARSIRTRAQSIPSVGWLVESANLYNPAAVMMRSCCCTGRMPRISCRISVLRAAGRAAF
ncbi:MAG: carbohydrate ABC transporter permease [Bifidobacterium breve]